MYAKIWGKICNTLLPFGTGSNDRTTAAFIKKYELKLLGIKWPQGCSGLDVERT